MDKPLTTKEQARMEQLLRANYALPKADRKRLANLLRRAVANQPNQGGTNDQG